MLAPLYGNSVFKICLFPRSSTDRHGSTYLQCYLFFLRYKTSRKTYIGHVNARILSFGRSTTRPRRRDKQTIYSLFCKICLLHFLTLLKLAFYLAYAARVPCRSHGACAWIISVRTVDADYPSWQPLDLKEETLCAAIVLTF